jgi:hypothetical protein
MRHVIMQRLGLSFSITPLPMLSKEQQVRANIVMSSSSTPCSKISMNSVFPSEHSGLMLVTSCRCASVRGKGLVFVLLSRGQR